MSETTVQYQYQRVADTLRKRIELGDYVHTEIPPVRRLASNMKVSHIVARKAVESLIKEGLVVQHPNGRLNPNRRIADTGKKQLSIAFLAPAFDSGYTTNVRIAVEQAVAAQGGLLRPVDYVHWEDRVIEEVTLNFDGVVLLASSEALPESTLKRLTEARARVVTVDYDLTTHGIPCISLFHGADVKILVDHLAGLGHTQIDCFNTQPECLELRGRIRSWTSALKGAGATGRLISHPVQSYERPMVRAYTEMSRLLAEGYQFAQAIFFTNESAAKGAMRALVERKIEIGKDISICAIGDLNEGRYNIPSLTCIEMPDATPFFQQWVQWLKSPSAGWKGPLMIGASLPSLFIGESTSFLKSSKPQKNKKHIP